MSRQSSLQEQHRNKSLLLPKIEHSASWALTAIAAVFSILFQDLYLDCLTWILSSSWQGECAQLGAWVLLHGTVFWSTPAQLDGFWTSHLPNAFELNCHLNNSLTDICAFVLPNTIMPCWCCSFRRREMAMSAEVEHGSSSPMPYYGKESELGQALHLGIADHKPC